MTRIFAIAALVLAAAATTASAMAPTDAQLRQVAQYAPDGADLSVLSHADVLHILGDISTAENANEVTRNIKSKLDDAG